MPSKSVRVPLAAPYNTRVAASNSAQTAGIWGVGIWGVFIWGNPAATSTTKDGRMINCMSQTVSDPITGDKKIYCVKRPGWETNTTPAAGSIGNAVHVWAGYGTAAPVISAFGGTNSTIYNGTASINTITGKATGITETFVSTEPTLAISSTDNTGWTTSSTAVTGSLTFTGDTHTNTTVDNISSTSGLVVGQLLTGTGFDAGTRIATITSATAITTTIATTATNAGVTITRSIMGKIVSANFPGNAGYTLAGTFSNLDGYACIMDTLGNLWASDLNTVTGWTATSFKKANAYPDVGIGCIRYKQYIMAFCAGHTEFFYNAGQTPFPLVVSPTMTFKVGCVSAQAITQVADTVFWCGSTPQGGLSIFSYDGSAQRVSPPEIDGILTVEGASNIQMTSMRFFGRSFVLCMTSTRTFVYCIEEKAWHEWNTPSSLLWHRCSSVSTGSAMYNYAISNTSTSGKVYKINPTSLVFTDDGNAYSAVAQLLPMDFGTKKRKFWDSVEIVCDTETAASATTISYYDDDYQTLQTWGNVDLSNSRPLARRLGSSRRREWVITNAANTPMTIEALEIGVRVGTS